MITASTILLALLVAFALASPHLFKQSEQDNQSTSPLLDQKSRCIQVLKDLDLDYATQKISEEDYLRTKSLLERELAELLNKIDEHTAPAA
jgi:hypothetical protein